MTKPAELEIEVADLRRLGRRQLKDRWRATHKAPPPVAFTPDLLARGIAWRLQEKALGGLSIEHRHCLQSDSVEPKRPHKLRSGNRLVRRWRGVTYVVEVTDKGLSYNGEHYASLSEVARKITGTRWSGPRFFGIVA